MKKSPYQIAIPTPCHESWDSMLPEEEGKFCQACAKSVIDFSSMSDAEIIEVLHAHKNLCGRMSSTQLNRPLWADTYKPATISWWKSLPLAAFTLVFLKPTANAGSKAIESTQSPDLQKKIQKDFSQLKGPDTDTGNFILNGVAIGDGGINDVIVGAQIKILKNGECIARALTDEDGKFSFEIKRDTGIYLQCRYIGYGDQKPLLIRGSDRNIILKLSNDPQMTSGEVIISTGDISVKKYKYSKFQILKLKAIQTFQKILK